MLSAERLDRLAEDTGFSGVVRVDRDGEPALARAYGWAHRGAGIRITTGTRLAVASGVKGLTALTVMSLVEEGRLALDTPARAVLGADLPLIDAAVTVEQLLAHRSGIGDYLDEEAGHAITDYVLPVPVHRLDSTEAYLLVLDGHPQRFAPGERFAYNNSGYVVLALLAERVAGRSFAELVEQRVCRPAGMTDTGFLRSDEPAAGVALGYLGDGLRTNVLHLPVLGSGDGGAVTTAADLAALWRATFEGRIVPLDRLAEMVRPRSRTAPGRWPACCRTRSAAEASAARWRPPRLAGSATPTVPAGRRCRTIGTCRSPRPRPSTDERAAARDPGVGARRRTP